MLVIVMLCIAAYACLIALVCLSFKGAKTEYPFTEPPTRVSYDGRTFLTGMTDNGYQQIELEPIQHRAITRRSRPRLVYSRRD